jgi:hypothetical protein
MACIIVCDCSIVIIVSCVLSIRLEILRLILNYSYVLNKYTRHRISTIVIWRGLRVWRGTSISLTVLSIIL